MPHGDELQAGIESDPKADSQLERTPDNIGWGGGTAKQQAQVCAHTGHCRDLILLV